MRVTRWPLSCQALLSLTPRPGTLLAWVRPRPPIAFEARVAGVVCDSDFLVCRASSERVQLILILAAGSGTYRVLGGNRCAITRSSFRSGFCVRIQAWVARFHPHLRMLARFISPDTIVDPSGVEPHLPCSRPTSARVDLHCTHHTDTRYLPRSPGRTIVVSWRSSTTQLPPLPSTRQPLNEPSKKNTPERSTTPRHLG
jgi:hypothetical protein